MACIVNKDSSWLIYESLHVFEILKNANYSRIYTFAFRVK